MNNRNLKKTIHILFSKRGPGYYFEVEKAFLSRDNMIKYMKEQIAKNTNKLYKHEEGVIDDYNE